MKDILVKKEQQEKQRYGRDKSTVIDHTYINSGEYRNKFDKISDNKDLNRLVYNLAKKMLFHRSGTQYEDLYWIDIDTLEIVADFNSAITHKYEKGIVCCHNGKVYLYQSYSYISEYFYWSTVEKYKKMGYDEVNSQLFALGDYANKGLVSNEEVVG